MTTATEAEGAVRPSKPVPVPDEASRPFFDGALEGKLMMLRCRACGTWMAPSGGIGAPVRTRCVSCFSGELDWTAASGRATLYSFALMHQLYDEAFADEIPYNLSVVELEGGVRLTTQVVGVPNDRLEIGMPLQV